MIYTKLQELTGIKHPIIQAGMGPYSTNNLCIAAAKAGALGVISTVGMAAGLVTPKEAENVFGKGKPKEILKKVIEKVYDSLKEFADAKFGVNIPVSTDFIFNLSRSCSDKRMVIRFVLIGVFLAASISSFLFSSWFSTGINSPFLSMPLPVVIEGILVGAIAALSMS